MHFPPLRTSTKHIDTSFFWPLAGFRSPILIAKEVLEVLLLCQFHLLLLLLPLCWLFADNTHTHTHTQYITQYNTTTQNTHIHIMISRSLLTSFWQEMEPGTLRWPTDSKKKRLWAKRPRRDGKNGSYLSAKRLERKLILFRFISLSLSLSPPLLSWLTNSWKALRARKRLEPMQKLCAKAYG